MNSILTYLKNSYQKRKRYFKEATEIIAADNLRMALTASLITVLLLIVLLFLTPYIIEGWTPTIYHLMFVPISLICLGVSYFGYKKKLTGNKATAICTFYLVVLFTCLSLIDTVAAPERAACFVPLAYITLFSLFIFPFWFSHGLLLVFETYYILIVHHVKPASVAEYDIFISIVGTSCAFAVIHLIMYLRTAAYEHQSLYKQLSMLDPLTGIYNRGGGAEAVNQYIESCNPNTTCTLMILDLNKFKIINDTKGHQTGDIVLSCMGDILTKEFHSTDIIVRFGGDEFMVLIKNMASGAVVKQKCRDIQEAFRRLSAEKIGIAVDCSIGAALAQNSKVDFNDLFRQADEALYRAKEISDGEQTSICQYIERDALPAV
ncbi:MAG TPA: GGDEF domain-containing protein [Candidatus Faecousia intestinigallinarum]|nr:GGDEF domain-containing protein [Candidatus Faecousia intestinigallinarum]